MIGEFVIVRCNRAGVFCGYLKAMTGKTVLLTECRRIWRWSKANSLSELSLHGAGESSRIAEPTPLHCLPEEAIEVIPCSEKATANLRRSRWAD